MKFSLRRSSTMRAPGRQWPVRQSERAGQLASSSSPVTASVVMSPSVVSEIRRFVFITNKVPREIPVPIPAATRSEVRITPRLRIRYRWYARLMPMRATTVRFAESLWTLVEREAEREGVSAAQFIRDASVMRAAYAMGRRGDPEMEAALGNAPEAPAGNGDEGRRAALDAVAAAVTDGERLAALESTGLLHSGGPDPAFDRHARLAAEVLNAPIALVSLVDADRQVFKGCVGLPEPWASARETPLSYSFCQHAVAARDRLIVEDARDHELLRDNLAVKEMGVVAYAGIPLREPGGEVLGTLCVIDTQPRNWSSHQVELLEDLAASVATDVELARR